MATRKTIFGSALESRHFDHLVKVWEKAYHVHTNLPFLQVCDWENLLDYEVSLPTPFVISKDDEERLKKTSIDYVVCDADGAPLVGVDFDGLQEGYNSGSTYVPTKSADDMLTRGQQWWRKTITNLKLKVAHGSGFPYFVVKSTHFRQIPGVELTIADGLIGSALARRAGDERIAAGFKPEHMGLTEEKYRLLSEDEQHELTQTWVIDCDTIANIENNPVVRAAWQMRSELGVRKWKMEPYDETIGGMPGRLWINSGMKVTVFTEDGESGIGQVKLTPVNMHQVDLHTLTESIAKLLALHDLKGRLGKR